MKRKRLMQINGGEVRETKQSKRRVQKPKEENFKRVTWVACFMHYERINKIKTEVCTRFSNYRSSLTLEKAASVEW